MKYLSLLFLLFSSIAFAQENETRTVSEFDAVKVSHGIKVILVPGKAGNIMIETRRTNLDDIETYVSRGVLRIKYKNISIFDWDDRRYDNRNVIVTVPYESLFSVESNTGAIVISEGAIKGQDLQLESSTGGEMELEVNVDRLEADINMGSVAKIEGSARILRVKASMGAVADFRWLKCEIVVAKGSMGAVLEVNASKEADITANMGAVVSVYGSPDRKYTSHSFGGEIDFEGHN